MKADDGLRDLIGENLNLKRGRMLLRIQAKTELRNFRSNTKNWQILWQNQGENTSNSAMQQSLLYFTW